MAEGEKSLAAFAFVPFKVEETWAKADKMYPSGRLCGQCNSCQYSSKSQVHSA